MGLPVIPAPIPAGLGVCRGLGVQRVGKAWGARAAPRYGGRGAGHGVQVRGAGQAPPCGGGRGAGGGFSFQVDANRGGAGLAGIGCNRVRYRAPWGRGAGAAGCR